MNIILAVIAHFSLIVIGLSWFNMIRFRLENEFPEPPIFPLLMIFGIYGALALFSLHALTWMWSGMASLGLFALLFIAPLIGLQLSYSLRTSRHVSKYHKRLFILGIAYIPIAGLVLGGLYLVVTLIEEGHL